MADDEIAWPVGMTDEDPDPSSRPMAFDPKGFRVAILADYARYAAQQSLPRRVVAALTDGEETLDLYHGHARDGRCALWIHVPDDDEADRAIRALAGCPTLHIRHYGQREQSDFYLRRPTHRPPDRRRQRKVPMSTSKLDDLRAPPTTPGPRSRT
jgi:hypothetical protein